MGRGGLLRVIAGTLRGRTLETPEWDGLRPSSDRLRETVFNILSPKEAERTWGDDQLRVEVDLEVYEQILAGQSMSRDGRGPGGPMRRRKAAHSTE